MTAKEVSFADFRSRTIRSSGCWAGGTFRGGATIPLRGVSWLGKIVWATADKLIAGMSDRTPIIVKAIGLFIAPSYCVNANQHYQSSRSIRNDSSIHARLQ